MKAYPDTELILNPDGSIYHLNLLPEQVAPLILTVGDPGRVPMVSRYFDRIDFKREKREFRTHSGELNGRRLMVISTGIGPDNIDIVLNELDALVNIDLKARALKDQHTQLSFVRLGTSGAVQPDLPPDSIVVGAYGLGLDNLLSFYNWTPSAEEQDLGKQAEIFFEEQGFSPSYIYGVAADDELVSRFSTHFRTGITLTCPGFYGPQFRRLRALGNERPDIFEQAQKFSWQGKQLTNIEMETSAIFGLSKILGHKAVSVNAILANRATQVFSADPAKMVDHMIQVVLEHLTQAN
jgi:uridine phosphorylase